MCANETQYSTKRTLYAIISRQMTKTVDYFTQQWNLDFNMDVCEWDPILDETHPVWIISRQMTKTVDYFTQQWNLDFNMDVCEWGPIFDETHPVCNHFTANDQNRRLFHTTVKFGFQYGCVRMRPNIRRNAPCMQSFHGKWPKPWTISQNSEIWISISMCANKVQYSTKRTLYAIISRQMTETKYVDVFIESRMRSII